MTEKILSADWGEYDLYKHDRQLDPERFLTENDFECNFLMGRIRAAFPHYSEINILLAIHKVKRLYFGSCTREVFVHKVMEDLRSRSYIS